MPFHAQSLFTAPPWPKPCREQRRVWLARVELHRRAGRLTALHAVIGRCLMSHQGVDGRLDPGHDRLAAAAACCPRTVRTALRRLRWLGMLAWTRRLVRAGRAVRQTSNAYYLSLTGSMAPVAVATKQPDRAPKPPRSVEEQLAALREWARDCEGVTRGATVG